MTPGSDVVDWSSVGVPLLVAVGAIVALVVDAFWPAGGWRRAGLVGLASLVAAGAWLAETGSTGPVVSGFSWVILGSALAVLVLAQVLEDDARMPAGESVFLMLSATAGALTLAAASDFVTLAVALELLSLPSIALVAMRRDPAGTASAWTFFLASGTATAITLMGLSLLYGLTGTLSYDGVLVGLQEDRAPVSVVTAVVVLVLVGLVFKLGAVPFHLWIPDAYRGASVPVAAFLSVVSKGGALAALLVVLAYPFVALQPRWDLFVAIVAALSMTVGNLGALAQRDVVGMLAWSSIAQGGFVLAPLVAVSVRADVVLTAPLRYLAVYAIATLTVFTVAAVGVRRLGGTAYPYYAGVARRDPLIGVALVMGLLALAGFPPAVIGLLAKYVVLQPVVLAGYGWLAAVMAVNVAIALVYYLRLIVVAFAPADRIGQAGEALPSPGAAVREGRGIALAYGLVGVGAVALVAVSVAPTLLFGLLPS